MLLLLKGLHSFLCDIHEAPYSASLTVITMWVLHYSVSRLFVNIASVAEIPFLSVDVPNSNRPFERTVEKASFSESFARLFYPLRILQSSRLNHRWKTLLLAPTVLVSVCLGLTQTVTYQGFFSSRRYLLSALLSLFQTHLWFEHSVWKLNAQGIWLSMLVSFILNMLMIEVTKSELVHRDGVRLDPIANPFSGGSLDVRRIWKFFLYQLLRHVFCFSPNKVGFAVDLLSRASPSGSGSDSSGRRGSHSSSTTAPSVLEGASSASKRRVSLLLGGSGFSTVLLGFSAATNEFKSMRASSHREHIFAILLFCFPEILRSRRNFWRVDMLESVLRSRSGWWGSSSPAALTRVFMDVGSMNSGLNHLAFFLAGVVTGWTYIRAWDAACRLCFFFRLDEHAWWVAIGLPALPIAIPKRLKEIRVTEIREKIQYQLLLVEEEVKVKGLGSSRGGVTNRAALRTRLAALQTLMQSIDEVEAECFCPITLSIISQPVTTADQYTYEESVIEEWLETHQTSPLTNLPLENMVLTPNRRARRLIRLMCDAL